MAGYGVSLPVARRHAAWKGGNLVTLLLLFLCLALSITGVTQVLRGPGWSLLWKSLVFGLLIGWGLANLRISVWKSALLILLAGLTVDLLSTGGVLTRVTAVFIELLRIPAYILTAPAIGRIDFSSLSHATQEALSSAVIVISRIITWLKAYSSGHPSFDPVAAGFVWSLLAWLVASWAGWIALARKNALLAILPAVLMNLATLSYSRRPSLTVYLTLGITLLLMAIIAYGQRQGEWERVKIAYPVRKSRQVGSTALWITILLVAISALISSLSLQRIAKWTAELRKPSRQPESGLARSLGIQSAATPVPDVFTKARSPGLPRDLLIGSGPELSGELVMSVQVTNLASISGPGQQLPLYWRSFTYDIYTGHGWSSSDTQEYTYDPNQAIQPSTQPYHVLIQQLVRPVASAVGVIYAAGEPVSVSVATSAAWRSSNDLFGIQTGATGYEAQSLIPLVDEQSLRQAGQAYPEWVMSRYLALPDEVPARVKDLASELTATEPTPYDRARAIEKYLRTYPYTLDVTRPTLSHDLVDFFLFDIKKGYCDYYASAMVVLARAAGIPARLAIGYATGTYNVNSGLFLVTQAEAHSWPELYFPGIGWVPFEPTAGRPAFSQIEQPTPGPIPTQTAPLKPVGHTLSSSGKYLGIAGLALILLAGAGWAIGDEVILSRLRAPWLAAELYRRLRRYGKLLGMTASPGETPYEFAEHLSQGLHAMAGTANRPTYVDGLVQEIQSITRQVVRLSFRPSRTNQVNKLLPQWRHLRWRLRWMWIFGKWSAFRKRISDWLINSALPIDGGGE